MKENSHRVFEVCEKSGVETPSHTLARRLDGHRLYTPAPVQIRQACGGPVRYRARQLGWRDGPAQGRRSATGRHRGGGQLSAGRPAARQGPARTRRFGAPAHLRADRRLCRLQRRGPADRRRHLQAPARSRSAGRPGLGVAGHAVAFRECDRAAGPDAAGARAWRTS